MSKKTFLILLSVLIGLNLTGIFVDIFTGDSVLYAIISKSFAFNHDYVNIYINGHDWLDKPHFPFWVCAVFIDAFGASTWAYKLPSILFFFVGLYYTYKLAEDIYNQEVARISTLILASSLHIIISNNDTRAEAILLGVLMAAVYYHYKLLHQNKFIFIVLAALFGAAAVMTKGIFVLIIIYAAIFGKLVFEKEWKSIFRWKWLAVFLLTLLFTLPEIYTLYVQFDTQPDKLVFGQNGVSGIRFFLWDSQFGRFFNSGPIKGKGDPSFFIHTALWAYAPWAFVGFTSLFTSARNMIKQRDFSDALPFFGFTVMFVVFSVSSFQLPHYTNILFPFWAILSAALLVRNNVSQKINNLLKFSVLFYGILYILLIILLENFFKTNYAFVGIVLVISSGILIMIFYKRANNPGQQFVAYGVLATTFFGLYLNFSFYPSLFNYQSGVQAAVYCNTNFPGKSVISNTDQDLLDYYLKATYKEIYEVEKFGTDKFDKGQLVYADQSYKDALTSQNVDFKLITTFDHFHITRLTKDFINYQTRKNVIEKRYLLQIQ